MNYNFVFRYGAFIPDGFLEIDYPKQKLINNPDGLFEMPKLFDGSDNRMYIRQHMMFPQSSLEKNLQGKINVQFTIDKNGKIDNISIINGLDEPLDKSVCITINSMPKIRPATLNGNNIDVYLIIPIGIKLIN